VSDDSQLNRSLRTRLGGGGEDRLGRAFSDLLENPLLHGAIGRAFDAREKAMQAQEVAMGALNLPSAADIERLTRRLRSVSLRLEGIEESLDRLDRAVAGGGSRVTAAERDGDLAARLSAIEDQLARLTNKLDAGARKPANDAGVGKPARTAKAAKKARPAAAGS
jgi:DNA-binding transcriptional MerR regulator